MGYLLWPGRVLSLAALHLRPGRLSYKLVYFDPAAAALPDCIPGTDDSRANKSNTSPEETPATCLSETKSIQFGRGEEPGVVLPAPLLWTLQTGHH